MITKIQFKGGEGNGAMLANVTFEQPSFGPINLFDAAEAWVNFFRSQILTSGTYKLDFEITSDTADAYSGTMFVKTDRPETLREHVVEHLTDLIRCPEYVDSNVWIAAFQRRIQVQPDFVKNVNAWIAEVMATV